MVSNLSTTFDFNTARIERKTRSSKYATIYGGRFEEIARYCVS
jgi:hypothetical protein